MKKKYLSPQLTVIIIHESESLMTLSFDNGEEIGVNPGEGHDAGEALIKENPFDFEWE